MFEDQADPTSESPDGNSGFKKLALLFTAVLIVAAGVRIFLIWRTHHEADKPVAAETPHYTQDELVLPRHLHQMDMTDARALNGKRIWVFAADQLPAYPATPAHMDYAHPGSLLLGAEPLDVVNFIEGKAPATAFTRIPKGDGQVFMLFHRPNDPGKLLGTPVGYKDGKFYTFYLDECFFYDDPHMLYKHWSADAWKAVDEHRAIKGMSEMQAQLALGQVSKPGPGSPGNRTVVYDNQGKPVTITFTGDKAISIS